MVTSNRISSGYPLWKATTRLHQSAIHSITIFVKLKSDYSFASVKVGYTNTGTKTSTAFASYAYNTPRYLGVVSFINATNLVLAQLGSLN
jgi:hypothetical protein